jgi:methanogenic corrinoid protein MtbC1
MEAGVREHDIGADNMSEPPGFQIGFVSLQTGLSTHVIRAWERRYGAVEPLRSVTGRRLFSAADIDRLVLLRRAVELGHSISTVAGLDRDGLSALVEPVADPDRTLPTGTVHASPQRITETIGFCLEAIGRLDSRTLGRLLNQAAATVGRQALLESVVAPLMETVGKAWSTGSGRILFGHFAAGMVHAQLVGMLAQPVDSRPEKPCLLIAAPAGQCCYLGGLAVALVAQDHGWRPVFIGCDLPAEEIVAAHAITNPRMIALSITCRFNDDFMRAELGRLLDMVGDQCPCIVGGRASHAYAACIRECGGVVGKTLQDLVNALN